MQQTSRKERLRSYWDKHAGVLRPADGIFDRHLFVGSRDWICSKATGRVLEVAIGTGLNLAHYPGSVQLTGVEWSPAMLQIAQDRARPLDVEVDLRRGDAQALGVSRRGVRHGALHLLAVRDTRRPEGPGRDGPGAAARRAAAARRPRRGLTPVRPRGAGADRGCQYAGRRRASAAPRAPARAGAGVHDRGPRPAQAWHRRTAGRPHAMTCRTSGRRGWRRIYSRSSANLYQWYRRVPASGLFSHDSPVSAVGASIPILGGSGVAGSLQPAS